MREILFRGKQIDNGKWVEGWYCQKKTGHYEEDRFVEDMLSIIIASMTGGGYQYATVNHETVCQYIGLRDKNGEKIFEGDIVKHFNCPENNEKYVIGCIKWDKDSCKFMNEHKNGVQYEINNKCIYEIIGNTFDNPDLLEVENETD